MLGRSALAPARPQRACGPCGSRHAGADRRLQSRASAPGWGADSDRDRVYVVDLPGRKKVADITLSPGDEPGRVIEDGAGRVHVVLRASGKLATIDPASWTVTATRTVCPAPRGAAWDKATDIIYVACAGGELVSMPAAGGAAVRTVVLDRDLRDVAIYNGQLYRGNPRDIPLNAHAQIQLEVGRPLVSPISVSFPNGL